MLSRANTISFQGMTVLGIDVQVHLSAGMPVFTIVGLPDKAVGESRERIRASLYSLGLALPPQRITVNLSPADLQKEGSHYDLPVALALLATMGVLPAEEICNHVALGELALDGGLVRVTGGLPTALYCLERNFGLICPISSGAEAAWAKGVPILAAPDLLSIINHFRGQQILPSPTPLVEGETEERWDLSEVKGQESAKRALEVAAAGGHNLLLSGPPGAGKSMLAARMPGILPPLRPHEALEVTMIHSLAGTLKEGRLMRRRPYRAPHHSCSLPAMVGGGARPRPGEISLAHHGILFLDELPEFSRGSLESLRQPLENGEITISRAQAHVTYPARVQVIAAMNPCRCGYMGNPVKQCSRVPLCGRDYLAKLSGPLLDRFDLRVDVQAVTLNQLRAPLSPPSSAVVAKRVAQAWERQWARQGCLNAQLANQQLEEAVCLSPEAHDLIIKAAERYGLTARGYQRVLKVARTIGDLENVTSSLERPHVAEALGFRMHENG